MIISNIFRQSALLATLAAAAAVTHAAPITTAMTAPDANGVVSYNGVDREGSFSKATGGFVVGNVTGTPQANDVGTLFGGTWLKEGALTGVGTNDLLTASLDLGSTWGNGPLWGSWSIDSSFWDVYGSAVISIHVGNGNKDPDWFLWQVKAGETSGDFYYKRITNGGGGLSNMFLWGSGTPTTTHKVPDAGYSMILVGLGLLLLASFRRKAA